MKPESQILKLAAKFFAVFTALFLAVIILAFILSAAGTGEQNIAAWIFFWLMTPALLFQMAAASITGGIYMSSFGVIAILGALVFYFLVCLLLVWLYTRFKSRSGSGQ